MKKLNLLALLIINITLISIYSSPYTFSYDGSVAIEAQDNELGLIQSNNLSDLMKNMSESLKEEYKPEWIEKYVSESQRYGFSKSYSKTLASILPLTSNYYFIEPKVGDGECELTIREEDNSSLTFVYDSKSKSLIAISLSENL